MSDQRPDLDELRERLDAVGELPIEQRPALFEAANRALVSELDALGE